jgi:non-specific serine/threonine protein kinase
MSTPSLSQYKDYLQVRNLTFHNYQWEGLRWCVEQENDINFPGGIVADEMGLGKTILMISTISLNMCLKTLIVLPPVLINQWKNKIYELTGHKPFVFHGNHKKKATIELLNSSPIVICSYHSISISPKFLEAKLLHKIKWNRIIFDECHHLRNSNTSLFIGAFNLKAKCKWFLSGTPLQNKLKDIVNIISLLRHFKCALNNEKIKDLLFSKMIRRTKTSVGLKMPELHIEDIKIHWAGNNPDTSLSQDIHSAIPMSGVSIEKQTDFGSFLNKNKVIVAMLRAKQVCIYPKLIYNYLHRITKNNEYLEFAGNEKLDLVISYILQKKNNGKGKLVFCEFRDEIDYIKLNLQKQKMVVGKIDGRHKDSLNEIYDVLILQIKSCCEGLNLQENFSEMYFTSNQWNPSIEDQAIGRCFRIGQKNDVFVYKFTMDTFYNKVSDKCAKSLENYIQEVQQIKRGITKEYIL